MRGRGSKGEKDIHVFSGNGQIFWEFGHCFFLFLLWFFLVVIMPIVKCHGAWGMSHFTCRWNNNEVRGYFMVTLGVTLKHTSFW
jgi:hypothetical protein